MQSWRLKRECDANKNIIRAFLNMLCLPVQFNFGKSCKDNK